MKHCPSCQSMYTDDRLRFCLQDGADLVSTNSENYPTEDFADMETVVRRDPISSDWENSRVTQVAVKPEAKRSNPLLIVGIAAVGICILFGGIGGAAWLWMNLGNSKDEGSRLNSNYETPIVMPTRPSNTNSDLGERTGWEPIDPNASLNGERLTFYRGTTAERCQDDCDANPKCRAFGLVRAGAYNAEDPPMCYLLSKVTSSTPSSCCISGVKK